MPPGAARSFFVILFDLKTQSKPHALNALSTILLYKQLTQTKDQYKLFLVNTAKSSKFNNLTREGVFYLDADAKMETILEEIQAMETGNSDWLEALDMAIAELKEWFEKPGIITLQVVFITDLSSFERPTNGELFKSIAKDLKEYDMFLYVIGPNIEPPKIILSKMDIEEWMQSLQVDKTNSNLKIMKKIVTHTPHSVMCSYELGVHLFNSFKYRKGKQPWLVPLTFGTTLKLPVSTMRLTKKDAPFKLKSTALRTAGEDKWVYEDQEDVELSFHDTVGGLVKHGKFVKIDTDGRFKIDGPRSFMALGFTSAENVPEYLLQSDGSYVVIPDQNQSEEYLEFFSTLVDELEESNTYIIARRVYNKNFNPKFEALIPKSDSNIKGFIMCELPYADDMAHDYNEHDIGTALRVEKNQEIFSFLDSINVSKEDCKFKVPLAPAMMVDPNCLNIIKKVKEKTIDEKFFQTNFDGSNADTQNFVHNIKNEWPVRELLKPKKETTTAEEFDEIGDFDFS